MSRENLFFYNKLASVAYITLALILQSSIALSASGEESNNFKDNLFQENPNCAYPSANASMKKGRPSLRSGLNKNFAI